MAYPIAIGVIGTCFSTLPIVPLMEKFPEQLNSAIVFKIISRNEGSRMKSLRKEEQRLKHVQNNNQKWTYR